MKGNKFKITNDKGITLIALVITIVVMLIIVGISVNAGIETLDNTKLQALYTELGIIQKRVDDIVTTNETYIAGGSEVELQKINKDYETTLPEKILIEAKDDLEEIFGDNDLSLIKFQYFTTDDLASKLNLKNMKNDVYIHFASRTIVSKQGVTANGKNYYVLKNQMYFPQEDTEKNKVKISLSYGEIKEISEDNNNYKTTVTVTYSPTYFATDGILKYKKSSSTHWETSNNLDIILNSDIYNNQEYIDYDVFYQDNNKNSVSGKIKIKLVSGKPVAVSKIS